MKTLKINKELLQKHIFCLSKDKKKAFALYYIFRSLYQGGIFLNYNSRKKDLCNYIRVKSTRTLDKYIKTALQLGILKLEGKHLIFKSQTSVCNRFGNIRNYSKEYKFNASSIDEVLTAFNAIRISIKLNKQKTHIIYNEIENTGATISDLKKRGSISEINNVTIGCRGIASTLGYSSVSSGYRQRIKAEKYNFLISKKQNPELIFSNVGYNIFKEARNNVPYIYIYYSTTDGKIYKKLPNLISIIRIENTDINFEKMFKRLSKTKYSKKKLFNDIF